jgi:hypothetical protein
MPRKSPYLYKRIGDLQKQIDSTIPKVGYYERLFKSKEFAIWTFTQTSSSIQNYSIEKQYLDDCRKAYAKLLAEQIVKNSDADYMKRRVKYIDSLRK